MQLVKDGTLKTGAITLSSKQSQENAPWSAPLKSSGFRPTNKQQSVQTTVRFCCFLGAQLCSIVLKWNEKPPQREELFMTINLFDMKTEWGLWWYCSRMFVYTHKKSNPAISHQDREDRARERERARAFGYFVRLMQSNRLSVLQS